jgi:sugar phosphate isomerase/epimerase
MKKLSRRQFFGTTALGIGSALIAGKLQGITPDEPKAKMVKMPLGFQIWTVREMLLQDFPGTLKKMSGLGYKAVEMCSPPGYGFKQLIGMSGKEMKKIVNDSGLQLLSTHYGFGEFRNNLDERIKFANESGQKQMILSSFGLPATATLDDWKKAADELNKYGAKTKAAGIQMGYHNHHGEFAKIGDKLIYDVLMETFDPELVKMQFQVAVISIGYKAADYFKKYPGRFISAHLADYSKTDDKQVPVGKGVVDWKEFFASLKTGGVKNIFVEMDFDTFKDSAEYIASLWTQTFNLIKSDQ